MKLSIVIPARNEAKNIGITIDNLTARLKKENITYELVAVDDGSSDSTPDEIEKRAKIDSGIRLIRNTGKHGFGYAVRCGLDVFTGDAVIIVMADGSDDPEDVVRYYYILRDKADCAFGSRWIRNGRTYNYPIIKKLVNRLANTLMRVLFGFWYNDVTNAFKGYRRYVINGCYPFLSPHFNLTVEIPLKAIVRGYSFEVIPISWRNRKEGVSSLKIEEMGTRYLFIVLNIWLEKLLTRNDYRRPSNETFVPFS
jgi:dolichol-phosphate mannosyltransferase